MHQHTHRPAAALGLLLTVLSACAAPHEGDAPEATDTLSELDTGTTYNGWTQGAYLTINHCGAGPNYITSTFSRSSGDATRGGGACELQSTGTACSSDTTCTTQAQSWYGAAAYGYCYGGACYARPGSQADYCVLNANRAPGMLQKTSPGYGNYAVGCMTKTAGPNTACGGTNGSLYMRTVRQFDWDFTGCVYP